MNDNADRCFLAVKVPTVVDPYNFLQPYKKEIKLSVTKPENYHITTHFFGDIPQTVQEQVIQKIDQLSFDKFPASIETTGYFPNKPPKYARVLYMGIGIGWEKFQELYSIATSLLSGIPFAKRNEFNPHVTVARIKQGNPTALVENWLEFELNIPFNVDHLTLYKSHLKPTGAEYIALKTWTF